MSELTTKQMEDEMNLFNFRLWVLSSGVSLSYKSPQTVIKKGGMTPDISDFDAVMLDRALGMIKREHRRDFKILCKAYIIDLEDNEIAEDMGLSSNRVTVLRGGALKSWYYCWRGLITQDIAV